MKPKIDYKQISAMGNVNGLVIINDNKLMDVGKALDILNRVYVSLHKKHWQEGETTSEITATINDYMSDIFGADWPNINQRDLNATR